MSRRARTRRDRRYTGFNPVAFARAIEAEVRKGDTALIRKLAEALEAMQSEAAARSCGLRICDEAIALGRARLEGKP